MKNIGETDRIIRIIIALALFSLFFLIKGNLRWLGLIGLVPLGTAIFGFCPLYAILHISTRRKERER
jgi:hypothetical protein